MKTTDAHNPVILIIEDEEDVLKALADKLAAENFIVLKATTGQKGIRLARERKPNLVLLDLRLPDIDGYDVCRDLKKNPETALIPIIMLSTRGSEAEKIVGLEIGADDYMVKPYSVLELLTRIRVALRRQSTAVAPAKNPAMALTHGSVVLDTDGRLVRVDGKPVHLTNKEYELLALLMSHPGKALSRAHIMDTIWGESLESMQGTVDSHIKMLRKKLNDGGKLIETVVGFGYRWTIPGA